jgi:hypothetical protein
VVLHVPVSPHHRLFSAAGHAGIDRLRKHGDRNLEVGGAFLWGTGLRASLKRDGVATDFSFRMLRRQSSRCSAGWHVFFLTVSKGSTSTTARVKGSSHETRRCRTIRWPGGHEVGGGRES